MKVQHFNVLTVFILKLYAYTIKWNSQKFLRKFSYTALWPNHVIEAESIYNVSSDFAGFKTLSHFI